MTSFTKVWKRDREEKSHPYHTKNPSGIEKKELNYISAN